MSKPLLARNSLFASVGVIALTLLCVNDFRVRAQSYAEKTQLRKGISFVLPPLPPDEGEPGDRQEQGTRSGCATTTKELTDEKSKPITALVPVYGNSHSGLVLGLTTKANPTFWFYVPYLGKVPGKFVLQEAENTIYSTPFLLTGKPGIVKVILPSKVAGLKIGHRYHWFFDVYCQAEQPPAYVHGWIKRDSLSLGLSSQIGRMTARQRVALLAAKGIWYDALSTSAELQYTEPKDTSWGELLQSVGLDDVASNPNLIVAKSKPISN